MNRDYHHSKDFLQKQQKRAEEPGTLRREHIVVQSAFLGRVPNGFTLFGYVRARAAFNNALRGKTERERDACRQRHSSDGNTREYTGTFSIRSIRVDTTAIPTASTKLGVDSDGFAPAPPSAPFPTHLQ